VSDAFWNGLVQVLIITLQSVVLLVVLLVMIAFLLLFDRKIWAAVQLRKGPNVVGALRPVTVLRRPPEVRPQGADHPGRRRTRRCSCSRRS
jgi:formate hydrogenlyase subunit 4